MTETPSGHRGPASADELVVVHVKDAINPTLAGHGEVNYQSPPLPRAQACTLVRLLLGRGDEPPAEQRRWVRAIAGGRRTVTLRSAPNFTDPERIHPMARAASHPPH